MKTNLTEPKQDLEALVMAGRRAGNGRRFGVPVLVLLLAAAAWYFSHQKGGEPKGPRFATERAERGDVQLVVTATGNLEPTNQVTVGSELSGTALEVLVDSNEQVARGQKLAVLDARKLTQQTESSRAAFASAKARVNQAKATLKEKERTLGRSKELHRISQGKMPAASELDEAEAELDRAIADLESAEAVVDEAKAQYEANQTDPAKATITAPIDGTVLTRSLEPGQTVAAPELFVIAENLKRMKLKVYVSEADIGEVREGQSAKFTVDAWPSKSFSAKVAKVAFSSTITDNVVTYETELEVANEDLSLRSGMTATMDISTLFSGQVLTVPTAALQFEMPEASAGTQRPADQRPFLQRIVPMPPRMNRKTKTAEEAGPPKAAGASNVWRLRGGVPELVAVKVGLSSGRVTAVESEQLREGDEVIVRLENGAMP